MLPIANPRIVVDTNLWVSYFLGHQTKVRLKQILFDEKLSILVSSALLEEISIVLNRPKFRKHFSLNDSEVLQELIRLRSEVIDTHSVVAVSRDQKDDFVLSLCQDGAADFLLTGDADLLTLHPLWKDTNCKPDGVLDALRELTNSRQGEIFLRHRKPFHPFPLDGGFETQYDMLGRDAEFD